MKRFAPVGWALMGLWLAYMLYATRYAMLDDALIHLRYAAFLHDVHHITFDGVKESYGTSSLLYVSVLALLRGLTTSVLLPKIFSCCSYLAAIFVLAVATRRFAPRRAPQALWLGLLLTLLSPMAIRWLTDGMETSLVALAAILLGIAVQREMHRSDAGPASYLLWLVAGTLLVLLRIEMASLAALATGVLLCGRLGQMRSGDRSDGNRGYAPLLGLTSLFVGALLAIGGTRLVFGSFLPDTALAKSGGPAVGPVLGAVAHSIASSVLFGVSMVVLTIGSGLLLLWMLLKRKAAVFELLAWFCANLPFPLVVALACARGQAIQGIRHILWPLVFTTVWNTLEMERVSREVPETELSGLNRVPLAWVYAVFLLLLLPFDFRYAMHAMRGRAATFVAMRSAGLERFHNSTIVAGDVGFISYFSGGHVCDIDGLVNGREAAKETVPERVAACKQEGPGMLFVTTDQEHTIDPIIPIAGWVLCGHYDFTNVVGDDRHYVLVQDRALCSVPGRPVS